MVMKRKHRNGGHRTFVKGFTMLPNFYLGFFRLVNLLTPEDFRVFEWSSAFTRPIGFCDSRFKVTIENPAVLKHQDYWKRHCDVVSLFCWIGIKAQIWCICDFW